MPRLALRGIEADFGPEHADTFRRDLHPNLRADYVPANPPFNDSDWFRKDDDVRWQPSGARSTAKGSPQGERGGVHQFGVPPKGNANFAWMQHFMLILFSCVTSLAAAAAAPKDLAATATSPTEAKLSWQDNSSDEEAFHSFYEEGEAYPLRTRFMDQTEDPEKHTSPAFRTFTYSDGTRRSMREVCRIYTIDWYLKSNVFPDRRRTAIYQIYCNAFDTINAKLITPADSTILGFAWFGTDNDLPYRQYCRMEGGRLGYYNRIVPAAWWVMTATYIGHLFGDGFHWWHDQAPEGSDRKRRPEPGPNGPFGMGPYIWEPDAGGPAQPPLVFGGTTEKGPLYPREPCYNLAYTKLAEYRLKQYESFLTMPRAVVEYSLDAGKSWVSPVGNERREILEKAEKKEPLCFKWDNGGDLVMDFLARPFADSPEWNVKLRIAPGQERNVKMHRQWPMLRVFSKSNPRYGLAALSR